VPDNSATRVYGLAGIAVAIGVPLTALAVASLVMFVKGHRQKVQRTITEAVAIKDLKNLAELGLGSNKTYEIISKE
jgi:siroheme synthase